MADHMEDEEQVEALKRWWNENGRSTVVAVGLAIAGTLGWQQYQTWEAGQAAEASDRYAELLRLRESGAELLVLEPVAEGLKANHGGTTYAAFGALQMAAEAVAREDWDTAESELRWILAQNGTSDRVQELAELRLARVLASNGDEGAALAILDSGSAVYPVAFAMARGDVHLVAGRESEALSAYREAEGAALLQGNVPAMLESKIDSLSSRLDGGEDSNS